MKHTLKTLPGIAAAFLAITLMAADTGRERKLQQAIDLLETKGDTRKAIPLLEDVAKSPDQQLAARGLLYLGQAQEREGGDRARATYQRIVSGYASWAELASEARRRLASLGGTGSDMARLPYPESFLFDNLSMDGQWLGGTDWDTGDLIIQNVRTGEVRRLASGTADNSKFGADPVPSPDGKQFVYYWNDDAGDALRITSGDRGATPRTILRQGQYRNFSPAGWSQDGRSVLVSLERQRATAAPQTRVGFDVAWVSVADGSIRIIKSFAGWRSGGRNSLWLALSPDRRFVAYEVVPEEGSLERHVHVMTVDGTSDELVASGGTNRKPVWTPDSSHLLYVNETDKGIWSVSIANGKRVGAPILVKPDTGGVGLLGVTGSGSLIYHHQAVLDQVAVVEMEQNGARVRNAKPVERFLGISPAWSHDGSWLAFKRPLGGVDNNHELVLYSALSTQQWRFPAGAFAQSKMGDAKPQWYADGTIQAIGESPYRVSTVGERPQAFQAERLVRFGQLSADGKRVFRPAHRDPRNPDTTNFEGVEALDTVTGDRVSYIEVPLRMPNMLAVPSPDGKLLALEGTSPSGNATELGVMSVDGSGYRRLTTVQVPRYSARGSVVWSLDGRYLLYFGPDGEALRIGINGGPREPLGLNRENNFITSMQLHPDGSRLAYWVRGSFQELWELKNVASTWTSR